MTFIQPRLNYSLTLSEKMVALKSFFSSHYPSGKLQQLLNTDKIYFFDNARSGIYLSLSLLPKGSRVGIQPLTCPTVLEAIEQAGCIVVFVDINTNYVIDRDTLQSKIDDIDALIITHTFGYVANVPAIKELMGEKLVIEDCAHAFMSETDENKIVGRYGDFAVFSFGFAKFPSAIKGGYLLLNNTAYTNVFEKKYNELKNSRLKDQLNNLLRMILMPVLNTPVIYTSIILRLKERKKKQFKYEKPIRSLAIHKGLSMNICLLDYMLLTIAEKLNKQKQHAQRILVALNQYDFFVSSAFDKNRNYFMLPVLVEDPEGFISNARKEGVELGRHFVQSKYIVPEYGYKKYSCPVYEDIVNKLVTIPTHYAYPDSKIETIVKLIYDYNLNKNLYTL